MFNTKANFTCLATFFHQHGLLKDIIKHLDGPCGATQLRATCRTARQLIPAPIKAEDYGDLLVKAAETNDIDTCAFALREFEVIRLKSFIRAVKKGASYGFKDTCAFFLDQCGELPVANIHGEELFDIADIVEAIIRGSAKSGRVDLFTMVLDRITNSEAKLYRARSWLHGLIKYRNVELIDVALQEISKLAGHAVSLQSEISLGLLYWGVAVEAANLEVFELLWNKIADDDYEDLMWFAGRSGSDDMCKSVSRHMESVWGDNNFERVHDLWEMNTGLASIGDVRSLDFVMHMDENELDICTNGLGKALSILLSYAAEFSQKELYGLIMEQLKQIKGVSWKDVFILAIREVVINGQVDMFHIIEADPNYRSNSDEIWQEYGKEFILKAVTGGSMEIVRYAWHRYKHLADVATIKELRFSLRHQATRAAEKMWEEIESEWRRGFGTSLPNSNIRTNPE